MKKRLYKIEEGRMLCGVCGGIAEYLNVDVTAVRLLWVIFSCMGCGVLVYIAAALLMPYKTDGDK